MVSPTMYNGYWVNGVPSVNGKVREAEVRKGLPRCFPWCLAAMLSVVSAGLFISLEAERASSVRENGFNVAYERMMRRLAAESASGVEKAPIIREPDRVVPDEERRPSHRNLVSDEMRREVVRELTGSAWGYPEAYAPNHVASHRGDLVGRR